MTERQFCKTCGCETDHTFVEEACELICIPCDDIERDKIEREFAQERKDR